MTQPDLRDALIIQLGRIAPEIEIDTIDTAADLRDEFDIDSMDFLKLITALADEFACPIPEADYDQMRSFDEMLAYLKVHAK
ncbi:acyl carrier protein [uncultured Sulfitobacter sp.]|uniref:acyl carrier protein n=1 Tax=uncultured Sulfitobacter sp. TaxID=191468 RepID=UPI00262DBAFF|nr:acyl carrier protein [uncultured Sulfitobacter sp.]